jgi:hypothetical protein
MRTISRSPISHVVSDSWASFAETVLPTIGSTDNAKAHVAFHFGAMYVLQIAQQVIAHRSGEEVSLALAMLDAELDQFMDSHAIIVQRVRRAVRITNAPSVAPYRCIAVQRHIGVNSTE